MKNFLLILLLLLPIKLCSAVITVGTDVTIEAATGRTAIAFENAADGTGTIDDVTTHCGNGAGCGAFKFASFIDEGSDVLSTNDTATTGGGHAFGALNFTAPGDFTAFDISTGEYIGQVNSDTVGFEFTAITGGVYTTVADNIPASSVTFSLETGWRLELFGTGVSSDPNVTVTPGVLSITVTDEAPLIKIVNATKIQGATIQGATIN